MGGGDGGMGGEGQVTNTLVFVTSALPDTTSTLVLLPHKPALPVNTRLLAPSVLLSASQAVGMVLNSWLPARLRYVSWLS
jgi:hypothetical protein